MRYLVLYNIKPTISDWSTSRADFTLKKQDFSKAPMYTRNDGIKVYDVRWLLKKLDTIKYDGVIAYVEGDVFKGIWGTHTKENSYRNQITIGDKKISVIQAEHHEKVYRYYKKKGLFWEMKVTRKKTRYWQPQYTFDHELAHSLAYLKGFRDNLHWAIKFKNYDGYINKIPKKKVVKDSINNSIVNLTGYDLKPLAERKLKRVFRVMALLGMPMIVSEGYRSCKRQNELFKQRPKVTNARCGESMHQYGIAIDCYFIKYGWDAPERHWKIYGTVAKWFGFKHGGDWSSFKDNPHIEMTLNYSLKDFQQNKVDWKRYD